MSDPNAKVLSDRFRVLLVDLARGFGGAEVRVLNLARALGGARADCRVAVLSGGPLHARLQSAGLPSAPLDCGRGDPRLLVRLVRILQQGKFTVVDAHNVQSIFWGHLAAVVAGVRGRVATIHSDHHGEYPGLKGRSYERVLLLDRFLARETVVVSEMLRARYQRGSGDRRTTFIPNAVYVPERPQDPSDAAERRAVGCAPDDFVVLVPARLHPVKGHVHLLEAVALLTEAPRIVVLLAGEGPLRGELQERVAALGLADRVRFLGFVTHLAPLIRAADCICLASLTEAMPFAILEAAAAARPVLATAVGGIPALVEPGRTGLLVPPGNPRALAEALQWLARHPADARAYGLAAHAKMRREYHVGDMLEKTLEVYRRAVA